MADARDLKSRDRKVVRVRLPPRAPKEIRAPGNYPGALVFSYLPKYLLRLQMVTFDFDLALESKSTETLLR